MMRQSSHPSSMASSTSSPKMGRYSIFRKKASVSSSVQRDEHGGSDKIYEVNYLPSPVCRYTNHSIKPSHSDKMLSPNSPFSLPDLEASRSSSLPSPDSFIAATHDAEYQHLRENTRRIRKAASDAKSVDMAGEVYKKLRDESLQLCKSLLAKSRKDSLRRGFVGQLEDSTLTLAESNVRHESLDFASISPLDTRSSYSSG